jgi:hypothetical protein
LPIYYFASHCFTVLGQKVNVFVVDVLKVDFVEVVQMGRPEFILLLARKNLLSA